MNEGFFYQPSEVTESILLEWKTTVVAVRFTSIIIYLFKINWGSVSISVTY
jgi:hypothetical protein